MGVVGGVRVGIDKDREREVIFVLLAQELLDVFPPILLVVCVGLGVWGAWAATTKRRMWSSWMVGSIVPWEE